MFRVDGLGRSAMVGVIIAAITPIIGACRQDQKAKVDSIHALLIAAQQAEVKRAADSAAAAQHAADSIAVVEAERAKPKALTVYDASSDVIRAGTVWSRTFFLANPGECRLTGRIEAVSGGNKDVEVYVMTEDQFTNWSNSHAPGSMLYDGARQTITSLNVALASPEQYRFVVSNWFSSFTAKTVAGNATVTCTGGPEPREGR